MQGDRTGLLATWPTLSSLLAGCGGEPRGLGLSDPRPLIYKEGTSARNAGLAQTKGE